MVKPVPGVMTLLSSLTELLSCSLNFYVVTARNTEFFFSFFSSIHTGLLHHTLFCLLNSNMYQLIKPA